MESSRMPRRRQYLTWFAACASVAVLASVANAFGAQAGSSTWPVLMTYEVTFVNPVVGVQPRTTHQFYGTSWTDWTDLVVAVGPQCEVGARPQPGYPLGPEVVDLYAAPDAASACAELGAFQQRRAGWWTHGWLPPTTLAAAGDGPVAEAFHVSLPDSSVLVSSSPAHERLMPTLLLRDEAWHLRRSAATYTRGPEALRRTTAEALDVPLGDVAVFTWEYPTEGAEPVVRTVVAHVRTGVPIFAQQTDPDGGVHTLRALELRFGMQD
jgi:hypothetical protein